MITVNPGLEGQGYERDCCRRQIRNGERDKAVISPSRMDRGRREVRCRRQAGDEGDRGAERAERAKRAENKSVKDNSRRTQEF